MICYWFTEPTYFIFAEGLPELFYYSHIPTVIIALLVGLFVFLNGRKHLLNRLLLLISVCFSLWIIINMILWTNIHSDFLLFSWSFLRILAGLMSIFCIYFIYVFLEGKDIPLWMKVVFLALIGPIIFFAPTDLNVTGFDISNCDAFAFESALYKFSQVGFGLLAFFWVLFLLVRKYVTADKEFRKQILMMGLGIQSFLFFFFTVVFLANYLTTVGILPDSRLEMYGLFGMTIFMTMMGVMIVRFKTFNVSAFAAQALVVALIVLAGAQFTYASTPTTLILKSVSLLLTLATGWFLVRSVRHEIQQREQLEKLTKDLEDANERLMELDKLKSEFVSIASHQLRSPITTIRGYASMLLDGSFGQMPKKAQEPLERIEKSSQLMASSIEDYLNVSRIESGNMKYNYTDFNLKDEVEHIVDDMRPDAVKRGLTLLFRTDMKSRGVVHADLGKSVQIVQNLLTNSIKYTPEGSIKVLVRDDMVKKKLCVDIIDSGIGMSEKTIAKLFGKFERADNAHTVNTSGTGLGLFVAFKMAEAMGGTITAHSEGDGKGSRFTFEMPLSM